MNAFWAGQYFGDMMSFYSATADGPHVSAAEACAINAGVSAALQAAGGAGAAGISSAAQVESVLNAWFGSNADADTAVTVAAILAEAYSAGQAEILNLV